MEHGEGEKAEGMKIVKIYNRERQREKGELFSVI